MTTVSVWYFAALALAAASLIAWLLAATAPTPRAAALIRWVALPVAGLALGLALFSPLASLADESFAAHMTEHEMFLLVIPIAFLAARPAGPILRCFRKLPLSFRRAGARSFAQHPPLKQAATLLTHPIGAFAVSTLTLWIWHIPLFYDLALANEGVHIAEHISLLGSALLYWHLIFRRGGGHHSLNTGAKCALYLTAGATQAGLLGALLTFSDHVFYSGYLMQPRASAAAVLADQRLGGAIMWFSGPFFYGAAMALAVTWRASMLKRYGQAQRGANRPLKAEAPQRPAPPRRVSALRTLAFSSLAWNPPQEA